MQSDHLSHLTKNQPILFIFRNESGQELEMSDYTHPHRPVTCERVDKLIWATFTTDVNVAFD